MFVCGLWRGVGMPQHGIMFPRRRRADREFVACVCVRQRVACRDDGWREGRRCWRIGDFGHA